MTDDDAWNAGEGLRTGATDRSLAAALDPARIMAFPAPAGILLGPEGIARPAADLVVLACRAEARRRDGAGPAYTACRTSTCRLSGGGGWRPIRHRRPPAA